MIASTRLFSLASARKKIRAAYTRVISDKRAVTSLEYGILASILGLVLVNIFKNFGSTLTKLFSTVSSSI